MSATDEKILAHMKDGGSVTVDYAREAWGIRRLASSIHRIRECGFLIETRMIDTGDGGQMAEYFRKRNPMRAEP